MSSRFSGYSIISYDQPKFWSKFRNALEPRFSDITAQQIVSSVRRQDILYRVGRQATTSRIHSTTMNTSNIQATGATIGLLLAFFSREGVTVDVNSYDSIESLRRKAYEIDGTPPYMVRLYYYGHRLVDGNLIADYQLPNGSKIDVMLYMPGFGSNISRFMKMLNNRYNRDYRNIEPRQGTRGGFTYDVPSGFVAYGLKVTGGYSDVHGDTCTCDKWIAGTEQEQWPVAYFATLRPDFLYVPPSQGLQEGPREVWGKGIYCTPSIETAKQYALSYEYVGHTVQVIFMTRVNPEKLKRASDIGGPADYWIVEDANDIRPYKILIRMTAGGDDAA